MQLSGTHTSQWHDNLLLLSPVKGTEINQKALILVAEGYVLIMTLLAWLLNAPVLKWYGISLLVVGIVTALFHRFSRKKNNDHLLLMGMVAALLITGFTILRLGGIAQSGGLILSGPALIVLSFIFQKKSWTFLLTALAAVIAILVTFSPVSMHGPDQLSHAQNILFLSCNLMLLLALSLITVLSIFRLSDKASIALKAKSEQSMALHDIRRNLYKDLRKSLETPLEEIKSLSGQMQVASKSGRDDRLSKIKNDSNYALQLLHQMNDLMLLEANKLEINKVQSDVISFARFVVNSFEAPGRSKQLNIRFTSNVEQFNVDFDPDSLRIIISNLVSDAIVRSSAKGEIHVSVNREQENSFKDLLEIVVKDTGRILPSELQTLVNSGTEVSDNPIQGIPFNTYLGYSLAAKLIRLLDGKVYCRSKEDRGTRTRIQLKVQNASPLKGLATLTKHMEVVPNFIWDPLLVERVSDRPDGISSPKQPTKKLSQPVGEKQSG